MIGVATALVEELPPRARRILHLCSRMRSFDGTTSACAENTLILLFALLIWWNYLRVRGEYAIIDGSTMLKAELPPRARRILHQKVGFVRAVGTTSACAENTSLPCFSIACARNYLRVRGEYLTFSSVVSAPTELPPRARRIPLGIKTTPYQKGTTSACAENTPCTQPQVAPRRNYLRVRGEYETWILANPSYGELPPRARRIHLHREYLWWAKGTTSACAENTSLSLLSPSLLQNYLRVRGEYKKPETVP